jgi:hypothetical protein
MVRTIRGNLRIAPPGVNRKQPLRGQPGNSNDFRSWRSSGRDSFERKVRIRPKTESIRQPRLEQGGRKGSGCLLAKPGIFA